MQRLLYPLLLFFSLLLLNSCHQQLFTDENGRIVNLTSHPNKWLIINYWAPWCSACRDELPELNQFYIIHSANVDVYGVNYDHPKITQLIQLQKKMGISFPLLTQDPAKFLNLPVIEVLPISFVYNPQGILVHIVKGPQSLKQFESLIKK